MAGVTVPLRRWFMDVFVIQHLFVVALEAEFAHRIALQVKFDLGFMWVMAGGALALGYWEMYYFAGFQHIPVSAVAGKTQRAPGRQRKVLVKAAVRIMAVGALSFLKRAMLEFFMPHIGMAFTVQAGEFIYNIGVIIFVSGIYGVAEAAFAA